MTVHVPDSRSPVFTLTGDLPPEALDQIVQRVMDMVAERVAAAPEPYLNPEDAATYLACPKSRIYALTEQGKLRHARDGRKLKFRREWLDDSLQEEAPAIDTYARKADR